MGFLYEDERLKRLSDIGDPLEKVAAAVDWEMFRPILNKVFQKINRGKGGRPLTDGQKVGNREKSRTRARVEHVFGHNVLSDSKTWLII